MSRLYIAPVGSEWSERFDLETIDSFGCYWRRHRSPGVYRKRWPGVTPEYSVSTGSEPDVIPEDARDHDGQDGYKWVVVEIAAELGWGDADEETYQLDNDAVESVTEDEIRPYSHSATAGSSISLS